MWTVYILCCSDNSLYTGIAKNVERRISLHNAGRGAKYTRSRRPVRLVYSESVVTRAEALRRESAIKRLERDEKKKLIDTGTD
ncbi:MAG TPA: GIY-YIG nuclease family protein [Gammaproteobacteria bacterium]|nr:endonuclease [Chromatiales bacterium]HJP37583.1 GIY-YIG nuclease family protein [Gammaproteobacteria bacterium]